MRLTRARTTTTGPESLPPIRVEGQRPSARRSQQLGTAPPSRTAHDHGHRALVRKRGRPVSEQTSVM